MMPPPLDTFTIHKIKDLSSKVRQQLGMVIFSHRRQLTKSFNITRHQTVHITPTS